MGNAGWEWVFGVWFFVGVLLVVLDAAGRRAIASGRPVFAVAIVGLAALFSIAATQYNFRNAQRNLVYAVALAAIVFLLSSRKDSSEQVDERPAQKLVTRGGRV